MAWELLSGWVMGRVGSTTEEKYMKKIIGLLAVSLVAFGLNAGANAASEEYKAAMKQADADYHTAKAHCDTLSGA